MESPSASGELDLEWRQIQGESSYQTPSAVCPGEDTCLSTLPMDDWGNFTIDQHGFNPSILVFDRYNVPVRTGMLVHVHLEDGGTWGHASGKDLLQFPLAADLVPGTYEVVVWPYTEDPYVGPAHIDATWAVQFQVEPEEADNQTAA